MTNQKEEEETRGTEVAVKDVTNNLQEDRTEVLTRRNQETNDKKPATEGRRIPSETEVNKSEDQHITTSINSTQDQSIPTHENLSKVEMRFKETRILSYF